MELLIWSSRLLLPVTLCVHLLVTGCVVEQGLGAALVTLLTPGPAEIFWLGSLDLHAGIGRVVLFGCLAVAFVIVLLAAGMMMMRARQGAATLPSRQAS